MNEVEIRALVDGMVSAWNSRDVECYLGYLADTVVWDDPAMLDGPAVGLVAVRAFSESVLRAFPDFSYRVREPICVAQSGARCVVPWEVTATHTGYFQPFGLAPTRQVIRMQGVDVLELDGGKVARIDTLFNVLPAVEQALRMNLRSRDGFGRILLVWLQRCRAWWLRRTTKAKQ
jgi:hypothetical protein